MAPPLTFTAVPGIPDIRAGDDLVQIIAGAMSAAGLELKAGDVLVVAQKIVSKAEGRLVDLNQVEPSGTAQKLAAQTGKDARLVELILSESSKVVRAVRGVLIVRHRLPPCESDDQKVFKVGGNPAPPVGLHNVLGFSRRPNIVSNSSAPSINSSEIDSAYSGTPAFTTFKRINFTISFSVVTTKEAPICVAALPMASRSAGT